MDQVRRNIMLGTGGALAGAALAAPAVAAAGKEVVVLSTYVAGTAYHGASAAGSALAAGEMVLLSREPENDYDPRAVAVRTRSGVKLGYVPRMDNQALARLIDAGFQLRARIREVVADPRQPDIRLDVFLTA